jgi:DNA-binding NarL/FixJ family response regulator
VKAATPKVLLADEQPSVRARVKGILEADGFVVCAESGDSESAVDAALRERPDVCIVGLRLGGDPLAAISRITEELPGTAVIVLTMSRSRDNLVDAVRAGATGYLLQEMNAERIPAAVRGVMNGEAAVPRTLVARLLKEVRTYGEGRSLVGERGLVQLTPREWEVLNLLAARLSTAEIAERLFLSQVTVRRHLSSIVDKLGVPDRDSAVELLDEQS